LKKANENIPKMKYMFEPCWIPNAVPNPSRKFIANFYFWMKSIINACLKDNTSQWSTGTIPSWKKIVILPSSFSSAASTSSMGTHDLILCTEQILATIGLDIFIILFRFLFLEWMDNAVGRNTMSCKTVYQGFFHDHQSLHWDRMRHLYGRSGVH
jgi:hypothetical protein